MGRGDNRLTRKMRRRRQQRKKHEKLLRLKQGGSQAKASS